MKQNLSKRNEIEAAFKRLLPKTYSDERIDTWIQAATNNLLVMDAVNLPHHSVQFNTAGRTKTDNELEKLGRFADELAKHIESLHESTILTLAEAGQWKLRIELPVILRDAAKVTREADTSWISENLPGGKPKNIRAQITAGMLAFYYYKIAGQDPTMQYDNSTRKPADYGQFLNLVEDVFATLNLAESTEYFARQAIENFMENLQSNK
jgi:hypothetical protein